MGRRRRKTGDNTVRGFFSSLLYFALIMVVIYVLLGWAYAKESGESYNMVYEFGKAVKLMWNNLKDGWNS
jgi:hypothetical protein